MEHHITAISTHASGNDSKQTIHWLFAACACGQVFAESGMSADYRHMANHLSRQTTRHIWERNNQAALDEQIPVTQAVPRIET